MSRRESVKRWFRQKISSSSSDPSPHPAPPLRKIIKRPLRCFSLAEIKKATNDFDEALLIRREGFGDVYKGIYYDNVGTKKTEKTVAIRRFHSRSKNLYDYNFDAKFEAPSDLDHKHVLPIIGYCEESDHEKIIVYEYLPNGSLANHLCTKTTSSSFSLSWEQCLRICIDAAHGLEYLHSRIVFSSGERYVHTDVTATNILLDGNGVAKISDIFESWKIHVRAIELDPARHSTSNAKQHSDVYAFGMLLVKVLSRKVTFDEEDWRLGAWFRQCIMEGTLDHIIHPEMKAQISPDRLKAFIHVAGECLRADPDDRPKMAQVVKKLESAMASSSQRICAQYSAQEMKEATNNFETILGEGGEGKVYKGVTKTIINVAVKCLKPEFSLEFEKEIKMLSNLDHPNLVSLVGYCNESVHKMLIYEYMPNGNLQTALRESSLSWEQRLKICIGAARGLRHLHTGTKESRKGIIHRDMKPANILLDKNFEAKVSDFGLSKMSVYDQTNSEMATRLKGTCGYYAPEYIQHPTHPTITRRIDVYAFGVILTEVLCRKKPWDRGQDSFYPSENEKYGLWAKENVDPDIKGAISTECLEAYTDILEKCLRLNPNRRPSMYDVVSVLENALKWQQAPEKLDSDVLFYLPGGDDRVVLYYTSNSDEVGRTFEDCLKVRLLMRRFKMPVDERDPTKDLYAKEFKHIFGNTKDIRLPQVFIRGKYIGGSEILYKTRKLAKLLGVSPPSFVCQSCAETRACDVCSREQWYVLCKNCDALTIVSKKWKGESRSCLECNGNQVIFKSILEIL